MLLAPVLSVVHTLPCSVSSREFYGWKSDQLKWTGLAPRSAATLKTKTLRPVQLEAFLGLPENGAEASKRPRSKGTRSGSRAGLGRAHGARK